MARDPEPTDLRLDPGHVDDEQSDDAAQVTHAPSQTGDATDLAGLRDVVEHAVVQRAADIRDDRADSQQHQPKEEVGRMGLDEEQQPGHHGQGPGEPFQGSHLASSSICPLADDRRQQGDRQTGQTHRP